MQALLSILPAPPGGGLVDLWPYTMDLWPISSSIWNLVYPCHNGGEFLFYFSDWMYVACDMRSSTQTPYTFIVAMCACTHAEVIIHCSLLSKFHPLLHHSIAITKYRDVHTCCTFMHACTTSTFCFGAAWYLLDDPTKYHEDPTSFSWNMRVCLLPQVECSFPCAVRAYMHMHTHEHY